MPELLSPAGDLERLKIALLYGADAVYIGGTSYSLRANAINFSLEDIKNGVIFAHKLNKKVYVTVNIIFHNKDISGLEDYLKELKNINIDAIIASDIYVVYLAKKIGLDIILSTQASVMNYETVNFWKSLGVRRIVLARECSREDIITIKEKTGVEIECFIHGAMCTSISGKCILSNYMTNRDSNRGGCAQICRWTFKNENKPEFTLMSKDLNMSSYLEDMINIGIDSFKVEGRMRSIYYIATVIKCYRNMIDKISNHTLTSELSQYYNLILDRVANRDSIHQFYNSLPGVNESYFSDREEVSNQDFLGIVIDYNEDTNIVTLEQRNYFEKGTEVEFISPNLQTFAYTINVFEDKDGNILEVARHPKMIVKFKVQKHLEKYSMMRLKVIDKKNIV